MNREAINALGGKIFQTLLEDELTEAEVVSALAIGITMRLAYGTESFEQLIQKLEKLNPIFLSYAKQNIELIQAAQKAKAEAEVKP